MLRKCLNIPNMKKSPVVCFRKFPGILKTCQRAMSSNNATSHNSGAGVIEMNMDEELSFFEYVYVSADPVQRLGRRTTIAPHIELKIIYTPLARTRNDFPIASLCINYLLALCQAHYLMPRELGYIAMLLCHVGILLL